MKTLKKILFLGLAFALVFPASAQKKLTPLDAAYNLWVSLSPEDFDQIVWRDNSSFTYIEDYSEIKQINTDGSTETVINLEHFNEELDGKGIEPVRYFWDIKWANKDNFYYQYKNKIFVYNATGDYLALQMILPDTADNVFFNPKVNKAAFTLGNNIYVIDEDGNMTQITHDTEKWVVNGDDYVYRQEFGIDKGIFWSPEGNFIAFYHEDKRPISDYPLVDYTVFPAKTKIIKYPFNGRKDEYVSVGIYDLKTGKTVFIEPKDTVKEHYLLSVTWGPEEKYIYIAVLNRDQNFMKLNKYDAKTGKFVKTLFTERNRKYVEPEHPLYFLPKSKDKFIWFSERDGYQHLYLYNTDGKLIKQLTKGKWVVTELYGISPDEKYVYFQATAESPIERHIYRVNVKTTEIQKLTNEAGFHYATFSPDFEYFTDNFSSVTVPRIIDLRKSNGKLVKRLLKADNPLKDYAIGKIEIGTIKAADGKTDLFYRIIFPPDFDRNKKYPAILYVYAGPHVQLIENSWLGGASGLLFYLAQEGFIVFTVDSRGSDNRGFEFESVTYRHLGVEEMKDQIKGVEFLKSLPFVDTSRIGVDGWSFGGYMTISLMTTYPNVFKVGVAGGPVIDWRFYEVNYGERYMDTPKSNPEGFEKTSILNKIGNLKGKLMIIHDMMDDVVVPQNTMKLFLKAQEEGIQIDFYTYPASKHNVRGKLRAHLVEKISDYFVRNLRDK